MSTSCRLGVLAVFGLAGCSFDPGGVGSGSASVGVDSGPPTGDDTAGTDGGSASASASASVSASASASGTSADDTGGTTPTATDPTSATDPTAATDPGSSTATGTSDATDATTSSHEPAVHHLTITDQSACDLPLWCFWQPNVWDEAGDPTYGQQCFTSPVAPPFELLSVHYVVADVSSEVDAFVLEVYSHDAGGPDQVIAFEPMTAAEATVGSHEYVFAPPLQIDAAQFCVGFATPYAGLAGALGMAVDVGSSVGAASYLRLEGNGGCSIPVWTDVIDGLDPTPSGNWCIDVQIRELE
ncbi:MAG TPA: hypothetical protein VFG69_19780 [Nannocystaceae bacterium]|nr:hypothetical protein [Nannocystaceae bacterium]